jgi:hypothetical protein
MSDSLASIYVVLNILLRQTVVPHVLRDESRSDEIGAFLSAYIKLLKVNSSSPKVQRLHVAGSVVKSNKLKVESAIF